MAVSPLYGHKSSRDGMQVSLHRRRNREERVGNTIFFYGAAGFGLAVLGAAWVRANVECKYLALSMEQHQGGIPLQHAWVSGAEKALYWLFR